jgi:hypothetical protein
MKNYLSLILLIISILFFTSILIFYINYKGRFFSNIRLNFFVIRVIYIFKTFFSPVFHYINTAQFISFISLLNYYKQRLDQLKREREIYLDKLSLNFLSNSNF